jgi:uncharacterized membrane protein HdeD (DUF308 family)
MLREGVTPSRWRTTLTDMRLPAYRDHRAWFFVYFGLFFLSAGVVDVVFDSGSRAAQWVSIMAGAVADLGGFAALYRASQRES